MQKVQTVDLRMVKDREFFIECYEILGFHANVRGDNLDLYWGRKPKKKKVEDEEKKPERRSKTERRLGKKFSS